MPLGVLITMRIAVLLLATAGITLALTASGRASDPQQWAVVVGIDDYLYFGDEEGGDLRGAESDALRVRDALVEVWGLEESSILMLLGAAATRDSIEYAFTEWLRARANPEDRVIFYYSGHGTQVWDQNGDEADGLDEAICPWDVLPDDDTNDILDDDLRQWLTAISAREKVVILDSCHSGTGTRAGLGYLRGRALGRHLAGPATSFGSDSGSDFSAVSGVIEFAAAAAGQSALEISLNPPDGGEYGGVFTTRFVQKMRALPAASSFQDLYWSVFHSVKAEGFEQDPQFSGPADAPIRFASRSSLERIAGSVNWYSIRAVGTDGVPSGSGQPQLPVGAVVSDAEGTLAWVAESGERSFSLRAVRGALPVADSVRPVAMSLPDPELRVHIPVSTMSPWLMEQVVAIPGVVHDPVAKRSDLSLRGGTNGAKLVAIGRDGLEQAAFEASESGAARLRTFLTWSRNRKALRLLDNSAEPFGLSISSAYADDAVTIGDRLQVRIQSEFSGYLTLVDFGVDGESTILFPNVDSGPLRVEAGTDLILPNAASGFILTAKRPLGVGHILVLVTPQPMPVTMGADGFMSLEDPLQLYRMLPAAAPPPLPTVGLSPRAPLLSFPDWNAALMTYRVVEPSDR